MRLQRLRISAFGPFADPVDLDFEALNDAGLFLLTGSNGAGKSSILDAVCFALYGAVPGERNAARRFRSDHASPDQAPTVELEAAFSSGTYRIVRTAAWERPKRRGAGTTVQQAGVSVTRRVGDSWQPVTSRLDEAGHLVTRLVGMNLTQFCQVVILPQGRFQAFLQSTASERQALLQQLFHTGRFQRVEAWLSEHRRSLGRRSTRHHLAVGEVLNRLSEVAGTSVPDGLDPVDGPAWAESLCTQVDRALAMVRQGVASAAAAEVAAQVSLEDGRSLASRLARHRAAVAEHEALEGEAESIAVRRLRLDEARRAAPVAVLTPIVLSREAVLDAVSSAHSCATARLTDMLGVVPADLAREADRLRDMTARFEALLPRSAEADALRAELVECAGATAILGLREQALAESDVTTVIDDLTARRSALHAAQVALPVLSTARDEAAARLRAREQVDLLTSARTAARVELASATVLLLDAKDLWLTLREARIDGMAAELAGALAVGAGCPVCGSADHPHPAQPHVGAPDAEAERAALRAVDDATTVQLAHDHRVRELEAGLRQARAEAGEAPTAELRTSLEAGRSEVARAEAAVAAGASHEVDLAAAVARRGREADELGSLGRQRATLDAQRGHLTTRLRAVDEELAAALSASPHDDARQALDDMRASLEVVAEALLAGQAVEEAQRAVSEARGAWTTAALEAGFASADDAEAARLTTAEGARLADELLHHDARRSAVVTLLADPDLRDLESVVPPDVPALETRRHETEVVRARAEADAETLHRRSARLRELAAELAERLVAWEPLRRDLELATHLSAFCEGKAPDNRWQIQLSAYVVSWRLSQVADAANVRLAVLTHGRYSLEHTDLRGAGERRGGMSLLVRDDWTGVARDPVTLSGGETFVVALALALGLADVITAEAGGASLQTLFVDEGFGMLDATSLDQVLDTLDSLRESGRTVGVVSHVAEMRSRIPVQIQVDKPLDHGPSTVRLRA